MRGQGTARDCSHGCLQGENPALGMRSCLGLSEEGGQEDPRDPRVCGRALWHRSGHPEPSLDPGMVPWDQGWSRELGVSLHGDLTWAVPARAAH